MPKYNDFELDLLVELAISHPGSTIKECPDTNEGGKSTYPYSNCCSFTCPL